MRRGVGGAAALAGGVALLVPAVAAHRTSAGELDRRRATADLPVVDGVPVVPGIPASTPDFLSAVRRVVPAGDPVRLLVGPGASCDLSTGQAYWLAYHLLPRPVECTGPVRWVVLFGAPASALPAGATVRARTPPSYVLAELAP